MMRFFRALLRTLPFDFRADYESEMTGVFQEQRQDAQEHGGGMELVRLWLETIAGIFRTAPREHARILRQDCVWAWRMMRSHRGYTVLVVLMLGLGIGATTAVFSVVRSVLLQPLPYRQGGQLIFIREHATKLHVEDAGWSVPDILDFRHQNTTLSDLVEFHSMSFILYGHGDPSRVKTGVVSWNYFDTFGVRPALGRTFTPKDDEIGAAPVLVLSNEYWRSEFAANPAVVGATVTMNDKIHTIVGVLPPIPQYPDSMDVYMPTSACPFRSSASMRTDRGMHMMEVFGRMKRGVSNAQAQADLSAIAGRIQHEYPKAHAPDEGYGVAASLLKTDLTRGAGPTLLVLLAAAGFVLLIVCANVANLTLSRLARRERELAVRAALGAGRSRLFRQLLTESFLLALIGGALGLVLAYNCLGLLTVFVARLSPRAAEIRIDSGVLWFTLLVALGTSLLFGTASAFFSRANLSGPLKDGSTGAGSDRARKHMRSALIVCQVAFSFVLVIGAGLMLRSLYKMLQVNPGFVPEHAIAMTLNYNWSKYGSEQALAATAKQMLARIEAQPGVKGAALSSGYPLDPGVIADGPNLTAVQVQGRPEAAKPASLMADTADVSPDYFRALGIPLMAGRAFTAVDDAQGPRVAIISQTTARQLFPGESPLGKRISADGGHNWWQIVGVVGDVHDTGVNETPRMQIYGPLAQSAMNLATLVVRTSSDPATMGPHLVRLVHTTDPEMAVSQVRSLDQALADAMSSPRTLAALLAIFAGLALLIAAAGIGGIMALSVSERTHEIGIRVALGAHTPRVLYTVLGQGAGLSLLGIAIGIAGALALTGLAKSLLFAVTPEDPLTYTLVTVLFGLAAAFAAYLPARRAASINPIEALRCE